MAQFSLSEYAYKFSKSSDRAMHAWSSLENWQQMPTNLASCRAKPKFDSREEKMLIGII